jgi:hypothetical protein
LPKKHRIKHDTSGFPPVPNADHPTCLRCNRKLVNVKWRRAGYGPTCLDVVRYERVMAESGKPVDVKRQRKTARGEYRRAEAIQERLNP